MANFDIAYPLVITGEGYYVSEEYWREHKDNTSGETYMGVDRIQNPNWPGWAIIDEYKSQNGPIPYGTRLPQSLGLEPMVLEFTKKNYWDDFLGDNITNQDTATLILEMNYMSGSYGRKKIQESINEVIAPESIAVDGVFGPGTLSQLNGPQATQIYAQIYNDRKAWYVAQGGPDVEGWLTRLAKLPEQTG